MSAWIPVFDDLLDQYKASEERHMAVVLRSSSGARFVASAWPQVERTYVFPEEDPPEKLPMGAFSWSLIWRTCRFSIQELATKCGLPTEVAERAFEQCRAALLIYPDGTVAEAAKKVLEAILDSKGRD